MALECKYFELNGINLVQFTHRITDSMEPDTGTIPKLGDENRQFARDDRGLGTIAWEGYVSNDETYLNLRKVLFDNTEKILKLHPEKKITLLSLGFKKILDITPIFVKCLCFVIEPWQGYPKAKLFID